MKRVLLGLGASIGHRLENLKLAVKMLSLDEKITLITYSSVYETPPMGRASHLFLNIVIVIKTSHSPRGVLALCKKIEHHLGRRHSPRWSDRVLDIDILDFEGVCRNSSKLTLPHPETINRQFVIRPLLEIDSLWTFANGLVIDSQLIERNASIWLHSVFYLAGISRMQYMTDNTTQLERKMKFFIDTANINEIREAHSMGIIDGVTTNPSLIAREGGDFIQSLYDICELVQGPVSAETVSQDAEGMVREGKLLAQIHEHIVVKVPLTSEGLKATSQLADQGIDVNVTLCFQPAQALLAAKAGAAYISPFVGRLDDISHDGTALIEEICRIYDNYPDLTTEVLAASIRHPMHLVQAALSGAHVATIPYKVIKQLVNHPLTDSGNIRFLKDWDTVPNNNITEQVQQWLAANGKA